VNVQTGIALAFAAMLCWGFGDFWIQKSTRKIGDIEALFFITLFGAIILAPFAYKNVGAVFTGSWQTILVLIVLCVVLLLAAIFDFEALRIGKLSVVEPIWSFEVPGAALLAFFILGERITLLQGLLIFSLLAGLILVSLKEKENIGKFIFERGTVLAFLGAVFMGAANFFMGWSSRLSDPVMANFVSDIFIAIVTGGDKICVKCGCRSWRGASDARGRWVMRCMDCGGTRSKTRAPLSWCYYCSNGYATKEDAKVDLQSRWSRVLAQFEEQQRKRGRRLQLLSDPPPPERRGPRGRFRK
jgi:transporter family protein